MNFLKVAKFILFFFSSSIALCQDGFIEGTPALAYWKIGNKQEIIIILHGGPGAAHNYLRPEWDTLTEVAQVIYYDQRGCGKSSYASCYGWREHVADLKRIISRFSNGRKVVLAGSSWGYALALLYTHLYPHDVKGLILSGLTIWEGKGDPMRDCSAYIPDISKGPYFGKDTMDYMPMALFSPDVFKSDRADKNEKIIETHNFSFNNTISSLVEAPLLQELNKIDIPVLAFEGNGNCGRAARKDGARQLEGVIPKLEIFSFKDGCHDPWYSDKRSFFKNCFDFIKKLE